MSVISNTTVLSNFADAGRLDLLQRLYGVLYVSVEVYAEVQSGLQEGYSFFAGLDEHIYPSSESGWIHLTGMLEGEELQRFAAMPGHLHQGEASCLAIAATRDWLFLSDDKAARSEAVRLGVSLSGSVGSLVLAVERGLCSLNEANTLLTKMIQQGYRSPVTDLKDLVQR